MEARSLTWSLHFYPARAPISDFSFHEERRQELVGYLALQVRYLSYIAPLTPTRNPVKQILSPHLVVAEMKIQGGFIANGNQALSI